MALVDNAWYVNYGDGSAGAGKKSYFDVTAWAALTAKVCGNMVRATAPAVGSERVFICIASTAGTGATGAAEPTWTNTRGAITADTATINWQEATGIAALSGDLSTNTPTWTTVKNTAVTLGQVIQNVAGTLILICTVAGTAGNGAEPTWAAFTNAGATTADNTVTWVTLGASFAAWSAPHARVGNAMTSTWGQAGNKFFIANNHAETQATSLTLPNIGVSGNPAFFYCVNRAGSVPPVSADLRSDQTTVTTPACAQVTLTAGNLQLFSNATPSTYWYGVVFTTGTGAGHVTINNGFLNIFENCSFRKLTTGADAAAINLGGGVILNNTTLQFGSTGDNMRFNGFWKNTPTAIIGSAFPTTLIINTSGYTLFGVDLSALGSGSTIMQSNGVGNLINCKLGASVTTGQTPGYTVPYGVAPRVICCDSGATSYRTEQYLFEGTQTIETTIIRTGGATDGTTPISWKIVSTASSKWVDPYISLPITIWNDSTSAITTLTIYGTTTGGGVSNNDDIWVEVEYLGSASTPQGSFITTTKADNLAASTTTNNSSDASTWGGGGAGNGFKMVVPSFTPGMKGPLNITIKVAKASSTYYIDPRPSISGVTVSKSEILAPGVYANELSSGSSTNPIGMITGVSRGAPY